MLDFTVDFTPLLYAANRGALYFAWYTFANGGWIFYVLVIMTFGYRMWLMRRQLKWFSKHKFIILAIDVPKDTEQTPKAIEQLFSTVSGAHSPMSAKEIYWQGKFQLSFSFEIVSIDGYVQFLIRTPSQFKELIESSIYSQYPDAEITEVEDYIDSAPDKYPNETHQIWGSEVILSRKDCLPIRTYTEFEDNVSGEFKDPMASILETMSKIQVGEQIWLQFIVKPTGYEWVDESMKEAYKIAGRKVKDKKEGILTRMVRSVSSLFFVSSGESMFWATDAAGGASSNQKDDDMPSMMLHLTPGEKDTIEAIEKKASKTGFDCKIRLIYISPHEQYSPPRGVSAIFGAIKQFNTLDLNSFKPDPKTKTQIMYLFIKWRLNRRRRRIMAGYKSRSGIQGHSYFILNIEELATLWHFPSKFIKAPLLQRTESKKSEAPFSLPLMPEGEDTGPSKDDLRKQLETPLSDNINLDNKYFEKKYAKNDEKIVNNPTVKGGPPTNLPTAE